MVTSRILPGLLFSGHLAFTEKILHYHGKPVNDVSLVVLRVLNTGNVPIERKDFDAPLAFHFGVLSKATVLTSDVVNTSPLGIIASVRNAQDVVTLAPLLLNPGDTVTIRAFLSGGDGKLTTSARVVGVPAVEYHGTAEKNGISMAVASFLEAFGVTVPLLGFMLGYLAAKDKRQEVHKEAKS